MYASKRQKEYTVDYKRERDEFVSPLVHWRGERERERRREGTSRGSQRLLFRILFVYASGNE